jgi:hypothetical protein
LAAKRRQIMGGDVAGPQPDDHYIGRLAPDRRLTVQEGEERYGVERYDDLV